MNIRLKKEFQSLFWPWVMAALIGAIPLLSWLLPSAQFEQNFRSVYVLSGAGFVLGIALLATMPFGEEFSLRTMPMLLSHPVSRRQIWTDKIKITLLLTITIALLNTAGYLPFLGLAQEELKLGVAFLVFTVSSGAFFTLFTRSTIGGTVLCLFTQALALVLMYAFTQKDYYRVGYWNPQTQTETYILYGSLLFSPVFLFLGWKLFARLQYASTADFELPASVQTMAGKRLLAFILRIKPTSPLFNLTTKELAFYKPVLVMGLLFSLLWIGIAILHTIYPHKWHLLSETLNGFTVIYVPLVLLICGCVSLGEEKSLGLHASNLTLPVSWKTQWLLKLSIAVLMGLIFGMLLPVSLVKLETLLTHDALKTGMKALLTEMTILKLLCLVFAGAISVGFWAATVTKRTIHAAFLTAFTILVVTTFHTMGKSVKLDSVPSIAYFSDWITAQFHLRLGWAGGFSDHLLYSSYVFISVLFLLLSWFGYRRQTSSKKALSCFAALILFTSWLAGCLVGGFVQQARTQLNPKFYFVKESADALHELQADVWGLHKTPVLWYSSQTLATTEKLSPLTRKWLEHSFVTVERYVYTNHSNPVRVNHTIMVNFIKEDGYIGYYRPFGVNYPLSETNQALPKLNQ